MLGTAEEETMNKGSPRLLIAYAVLLLGTAGATSAQERARDAQSLSARQQSIVLIASHTATGDLDGLTHALSAGLDSGLTINEIKEVLLQLYAYCGFPRSLQGINTFMAVLQSRETRGANDAVGRAAIDVGDEDRYEQGRQVLAALTGQSQNRPRTGYAAFFPTIDTFLKEHLFAAIFGRGILSFQDRELTTVAALVSMGGVEPMAGSHMELALNVGITASQLEHLLALIEAAVGEARAASGRDALTRALVWQADSMDDAAGGDEGDDRAAGGHSGSTNHVTSTLFPRGRRITSDHFTGSVWVAMLVTGDDVFGSRIGNVTFEPGARTNWHSHPGGQILLVTGGVGYFQEQGGPIQLIRKGDVVEIRPDVVHWHGATPSSELSHVAVVTNALAGNTVWLQPVTDDEYTRVW
jgi:quercetin dioxygenase-like cupin family protein/alkylhydroperoxidase/carboxymuconolactone decarboxylase family protein YurZ